MLTRLTLSILILSNSCIAQSFIKASPTKFDKFVSYKKIQWAAYANDTITFDSFKLNHELYNRFQKGDIKISDPLSRKNLMAGNPIVYLNKKQLALKAYPPGLSAEEMDPQKPQNRIDENSAAINVQQIIYVADGKLYSYIPWVSPRLSIYTSYNKFIGTSEYFSTAINDKHNFRSSKRDKLLFLKTTKKKILIDDIPRTDLLKQLDGTNVLEAIWEYLLSEKHEVVDERRQQNVLLKNVKEFTPSQTIEIPIYDSLGHLIGA